MEYTDFAGLTVVDQGESPWEDGGSFFGRNPNVIDRLLRRLTTHTHDGASGLADPTDAPGVVAGSAGGTLPADTPFWIAMTLVDDQQGETLPTPATQITTPTGGATPTADFTTVADYTAGDLPANTYYYVLTATDGMGGETPASDPVTITLDPGNANGQVILSGLAAAAGGAYRLYRSVNGGPFGFLFAGADDTFNDDCSHCADTQLPPPADTDDLTSSTATITFTVPALPAGATAWRVYVAPDPSFPSPSFVGEYTAAGDQTLTSFGGLLPGQPPVRSTSIGNPSGGTGGGGGGGAQPTYILPPDPSGWGLGLQGADLEKAGILWTPQWATDAYGAAIIARREDIDWSNVDTTFNAWIAADAEPFVAADWQGATAEYAWDSTQYAGGASPGGLGATGAVDTDNLVTRPDTASGYGDGHWSARFRLDTASWDKLMVGGRMYGADEGFLAVLDRAASKFQLVHFTTSAPLTYTVLAEVDVPPLALPGANSESTIDVRRFGDDIFAWCSTAGMGQSWLTASTIGLPFGGGYAVMGAFGARWSATGAVRLISASVDAPTSVVELVAGTLATTTGGAGEPIWYFDFSNSQVLWRSDGVGVGLPDNWQGTGSLGLLNGWADLDGDPAFVRWGSRIIWRGRLTNATGWNVGSHIADMGTDMQPYTARSFYVGAESSAGVLGLARIDVLPEDTTTSTPAHMVLAAVDPALTDVGALSLDGMAWEM